MIRGRAAISRIALLSAALLTFAPAPAAVSAAPLAKQPKVEFVVPGTVTDSALPLRVSWAAATPDGSPIYRYWLQRSLDGGPWTTLTLPSRLARIKTVNLRAWQVINFRLLAEDQAGNVSDWVEAAPVWLSTAQEYDALVDLGSNWSSAEDTRFFRGAQATTSVANATATFSFSGREVAWIAQRGPSRGEADVYVDGSLVDTVDLYKSTTARRRVVFRTSWPAAGEHTIAVVNRATAGRPTIDLDAFAAIGEPTDETLVGAGDIASCAYADDEATAEVAAGVDGIVFTAGDNVYPYGDAEYYDACYDSGWGKLKARTRSTPGNHDYQENPGGAPYFDYFGESAGVPGVGYYSFAAGTWRIYSLSSECSQIGGCGVGSPQYEWLADDLAAEPHRCVAAIWHHPRWSTAAHGNSTRMAAVMQLLYSSGADIVLSSHDHSYQRFAPADPTGASDPARGVRQFVVGTGGASLYAFKTQNALIEARNNTSHGVLRLDLSPGTYSWQFLPIEGATFTDSGEGACH